MNYVSRDHRDLFKRVLCLLTLECEFMLGETYMRCQQLRLGWVISTTETCLCNVNNMTCLGNVKNWDLSRPCQQVRLVSVMTTETCLGHVNNWDLYRTCQQLRHISDMSTTDTCLGHVNNWDLYWQCQHCNLSRLCQQLSIVSAMSTTETGLGHVNYWDLSRSDNGIHWEMYTIPLHKQNMFCTSLNLHILYWFKYSAFTFIWIIIKQNYT